MTAADDDGHASRGVRYMEYGGRGFWCRDGMLEIWLAALVDELDARDSASGLPIWLRRLRDDWHLQATTAFDGVMTCSLDPHVTDARRRDQLAELCRSLQRHLQRPADRAEASLLRRVAGDRLLRADLAGGLERVGGAFLWLLDPFDPSPANRRRSAGKH